MLTRELCRRFNPPTHTALFVLADLEGSTAGLEKDSAHGFTFLPIGVID
jgi:hypothetical protein